MKHTVRTISKERTQIFFGDGVLSLIKKQTSALSVNQDNIFILADSQTRSLCLPVLFDHVPYLSGSKVLEVEGGERCKSIETAGFLWQKLNHYGADRNSLLINLGGGVATDLGGFVAGGFQRGIRYFNVPTSLIGQADAAIGGKTGVNLENVKNQVGLFYPPTDVFIFPGFLKTLPKNHLRSGLAEIIKSLLLSDPIHWRKLQNIPVNSLLDEQTESLIWKKLISAAVAYKVKLVRKDFHERNIRKALNFGHTIGHAFESFSMTDDRKPALHGEAVAAGMICAAWLSSMKTGLSHKTMKEIQNYLDAGFDRISFTVDDIPKIIELMKFDKKNQDGKFRFTLLAAPGSPRINVSCEPHEVSEALLNYSQQQKSL
ncbi:MAG: 3-dehydroquinate synthase [Bacteroidetes bacterium]|nr:3-dehydroquinate synthase [Bacteroidota bacterium]